MGSCAASCVSSAAALIHRQPGRAAGVRQATLASLQASAKVDPRTRFGLHVAGELCKVVKVYDGDSLTLAWRHGGRTVFANCRLYGVDTPELRSPDAAAVQQAVACRDRVTALVLNQLMVMDSVGRTGLDKYGRPLVRLRARSGWSSRLLVRELQGGDLSAWMLRAELPGCKPYFGGSKDEAAKQV